MFTTTEMPDRTATKVSVAMSGVALVLSTFTLIVSLDDDARDREVDARLACLEVPGPNDCGIDE